MEYAVFWKEQAFWPRDTPTHVFLARALHLFGKALYPQDWTEEEPIMAPVMLLPAQSAAKRRDRLEAHRLLAGNPLYEVKPDNQTLPGNFIRSKPGGTLVDFRFTAVEWNTAREIQHAMIELRQPYWDRLVSTQKIIVEHATFGRLRMAARKRDAFGYTRISADVWAVVKIHAVFADCTVPLREFASPGTAAIFVLREDLDRLLQEGTRGVTPASNSAGVAEEPNPLPDPRGDPQERRRTHSFGSVRSVALVADHISVPGQTATGQLKWDEPPPLLEPPGFLSMEVAIRLFQREGDDTQFINGCAPAEHRLRRAAAGGHVSAVIQLWSDGSIVELPKEEWLGPRAPMFFTENGSVFAGTEWAFVRLNEEQAIEAARIDGERAAPAETALGKTQRSVSVSSGPKAPIKKRGAPNLATRDQPFIEQMRQLVEEDGHRPLRASQIIMADHGDRVAGTGQSESKARRLREGYRRDRHERGLGEIGE